MNAIVLDLETVPDTDLWQPSDKAAPKDPTKCEKCNKELPADEVLKRKCEAMQRGKCRLPSPEAAVKDEFPPVYAHKIVCCGMALIADDVPQAYTVWAAPPDSGQEKQLLSALADLMAKQTGASLVTWNGRGFDVPVIEARSARHGVSQPWIAPEYRKPGEHPNCDLMPIYSPRDRLSLHNACRLIGLPGKNGMDGSMVKMLVEAGQLNTAQEYCGRDVVQTAYLYLRYRLLRGFIDVAKYRESCGALQRQWEGKPGFQDFVVDSERLLAL